MKIRVIQAFTDVAFGDKIIRKVNDIIDTANPDFKCSEDLAKERIRRGFCEEIIDEEPVVKTIEEALSLENYGVTVKKQEKPAKKGKKASKKK